MAVFNENKIITPKQRICDKYHYTFSENHDKKEPVYGKQGKIVSHENFRHIVAQPQPHHNTQHKQALNQPFTRGVHQ
jgi:hypothetical protein